MTEDGRTGARWLRWVLLALIALGAVVLLGRIAGGRLPQLAAAVDDLGAWGPLALIAIYAVSTVALVPGSILTIAAGALFGLGWGTLYAFAGAMLGAAAAFLVSRHLARGAVERRLREDPRFERIDRAIEQHGLRVVFLLRLSPVLPFTLLNYALGLTRVRFVDYLVASLGMLPGTVLYVYHGKVAGEVVALGAGEVERGPVYYLVLLLGLVATVALTVVATRIARRSLRETTPEEIPAAHAR